ncbi:hypothetical protein SLEP1_g11739 [Rubroshorea leprosula]|nr:hypothetical protein SLEP1_g11739 [Rubroshorea leprosula]
MEIQMPEPDYSVSALNFLFVATAIERGDEESCPQLHPQKDNKSAVRTHNSGPQNSNSPTNLVQ